MYSNHSKRFRASVSTTPSTGSFVDLFNSNNESASGDPEKQSSLASFPSRMYKIAYPHQAIKVMDNTIRSEILELAGQNNRLQFPAHPKQILGLKTRYLCLQLFVPATIPQSWSLEVTLSDTTQSTNKLVFSPTVQHVQKKINQPVLLPTNMIPKNQWITLNIDVHSFLITSQQAATKNPFRSIEGISISSPCKIRRIFGLNSSMDELRSRQSDAVKQKKPVFHRNDINLSSRNSLEVMRVMQIDMFPFVFTTMATSIAQSKRNSSHRENERLPPAAQFHNSSSKAISPSSKMPHVNHQHMHQDQFGYYAQNPVQRQQQSNQLDMSLAEYMGIPERRRTLKTPIVSGQGATSYEEIIKEPSKKTQTHQFVRQSHRSYQARKRNSEQVLEKSCLFGESTNATTAHIDLESVSLEKSFNELKKKKQSFCRQKLNKDVFEVEQSSTVSDNKHPFNIEQLRESDQNCLYSQHQQDNRHLNLSPFSFLSHTKQNLVGFVSLDTNNSNNAKDSNNTSSCSTAGNTQLQNASLTTAATRRGGTGGGDLGSRGDYISDSNKLNSEASQVFTTMTISSANSAFLKSNQNSNEHLLTSSMNTPVSRGGKFRIKQKNNRSLSYAIDTQIDYLDSTSSIQSPSNPWNYQAKLPSRRYDQKTHVVSSAKNRTQSTDSRSIFDMLSAKGNLPRRNNPLTTNESIEMMTPVQAGVLQYKAHPGRVLSSHRKQKHDNNSLNGQILPFKQGVLSILQAVSGNDTQLQINHQESPEIRSHNKQNDSQTQQSQQKEQSVANNTLEINDYLGVSSKYSTINDPRFLQIENFMGKDLTKQYPCSPPSAQRSPIQKNTSGSTDEIEEQIEAETLRSSIKRQKDKPETSRFNTKEFTQGIGDKLKEEQNQQQQFKNGNILNQTTIKKPLRKNEQPYSSKQPSSENLIASQPLQSISQINILNEMTERDNDNNSYLSNIDKSSRKNDFDKESLTDFMKNQFANYLTYNQRQFTPPFFPSQHMSHIGTSSQIKKEQMSANSKISSTNGEQAPQVEDFTTETKKDSLIIKKTLTMRKVSNQNGVASSMKTSRLSGAQPDLELVYDDILNCYYDPNSQVYYDIQA